MGDLERAPGPTWAERTAGRRLALVIGALLAGALWLWWGPPRVCVQQGVGDSLAVRTVCNAPAMTDPQVVLPLAAVLLLLAPDLTEVGIGSVLTAKRRDADTGTAGEAAAIVADPAGTTIDRDAAAARLVLAQAAFAGLARQLDEPWRGGWLFGFARRADGETVFEVAAAAPAEHGGSGGDAALDPPEPVSRAARRLALDPRLPVLRAARHGRSFAAPIEELDGLLVAAAPARNAAGRVVGVVAAVTARGRGARSPDLYALDLVGGLWARLLVDLLALADDTPDAGQEDG